MKKNWLYHLMLLGVIALFLWACGEDEQEFSGVYDTVSNTDEESNSGSDTDTDSDSDTDTDTGFSQDTPFNICNEDVPEEHHVDGIPAYNQCDASQNFSIYTNDGINTATHKKSDIWVRTQMSGGYQCTEFAKRYMEFIWNIPTVPNANARAWCDGDPPEGLVKSSAPVHGDVIVFAPGSCGASEEFGHVAIVDIVDDQEKKVEFVEQNYANRRTCDISTAACFLHAESNPQ